MEQRVQLEKTLKPHTVMAIALGSSIGWGCFVLPGEWLLKAGPLGASIGFSIGALLMVIIAVSYGFMIRKFPVSGGAFAYSYIGFGRNHAFVCGWFLTLGYLSIVALNASALTLLFKLLAPELMAKTGLLYQVAGWDVYAGEVVIASLALIGAAYLNIKGSSVSGKLQFYMCMGFLAGAIALAAGCILHPVTTPADIQPLFPPEVKPFSAILAILAIAPWAYVGFDNVPQAAEEFDFSPKLAFMLIAVALILAAAMYSLLLVATAMATPWEIIAAQKSAWITGDSVSRLLGPAGLIILSFALLMGVSTGLNGFYVSTSRLLFAMSRARVLPTWFSKLHPRYGTPYNGIIFACLVCLIAPWFGRKVLTWIVDMSSIGVTFAYFYTCLVAYKYHKWSGDKEADDTVSAPGKFFSLIGVFAALTFIGLLVIPGLPSSLSPESRVALVAWVIIGGGFYLYRFREYNSIDKDKLDYLILGDSVKNLKTDQVEPDIKKQKYVS